MFCSSLLRWKNCFIKTYEDIGSPVCTNNDIEFFDQYTYKSTIEPLNIFCTGYDESDKCDKYDTFLVKNSVNRVKYGTMFPALIEIFENL